MYDTFNSPEQAMEALLQEASLAVTDAARAYLLKWAQYGLERQGMMTRDDVLSLLASCMKDCGSAYDNAQAYALAQVLGAHDQHELALYDELTAKAEREAQDSESTAGT